MFLLSTDGKNATNLKEIKSISIERDFIIKINDIPFIGLVYFNYAYKFNPLEISFDKYVDQYILDSLLKDDNYNNYCNYIKLKFSEKEINESNLLSRDCFENKVMNDYPPFNDEFETIKSFDYEYKMRQKIIDKLNNELQIIYNNLLSIISKAYNPLYRNKVAILVYNLKTFEYKFKFFNLKDIPNLKNTKNYFIGILDKEYKEKFNDNCFNHIL